MSEHTDDHLELCAAYAVGSIDPKDRQLLAEHLADGCLECEVALADFESSTVLLAASAPSVAPRPGLRARVLAAAEKAKTEPERPVERPKPESTPGRVEARAIPMPTIVTPKMTMPPWSWMAAAAAFAVTTVILAMITIGMGGKLGEMKKEVESNRDALASISQQLELERQWSSVLSAPDARTAVLNPTAGSGLYAARGRATFDPASQRAVLVFENLKTPPGRAYELWAIVGSTPVSLGVIPTDNDGGAILRVENAGDPNQLNAFAVSIEPPGGSGNPNSPSGPLVMVGRVAG